MHPCPTIVLVDDDPDDLMFIQDALEASTQEFKILPFLSSVAFVDFIITTSDLPVLVVMDYNMPKMNAEDILIEMKSSDQLATVKTFILSTGMNPTLKERLISLDAHCCITKPTSVQDYRLLGENIIRLATTIQNGQEIQL